MTTRKTTKPANIATISDAAVAESLRYNRGEWTPTARMLLNSGDSVERTAERVSAPVAEVAALWSRMLRGL